MKAWMAALAVAALAGCSNEAETGSFDEAAFAAEVGSWDEVLDVAVDGQRIYVAMYDDGSSRDGYAMSVCEEVRAHSSGDLKARRVTIIDAVASVRDDEFKAIRKHRCEP